MPLLSRERTGLTMADRIVGTRKCRATDPENEASGVGPPPMRERSPPYRVAASSSASTASVASVKRSFGFFASILSTGLSSALGRSWATAVADELYFTRFAGKVAEAKPEFAIKLQTLVLEKL